MFVLNPDMYSLPAYRIGPFRTCDVGINHRLPVDNAIDRYFEKRFAGKQYRITSNGRSAINTALKYYSLKREDVVTVLTTTDNFYISGCVTKEIEKFCKWSRKIEPETKLILVNHEFGYPHPDLAGLKKHGVPIIEDCATTFFSQDRKGDIGNIGDFVIYSFPKFFPIQIGGLLVSSVSLNGALVPQYDATAVRYIKNVLSYYITRSADLLRDRLRCYAQLKERLAAVGLVERFPLEEGVVPSVFMFRRGEVLIDLPALKSYLYAHGIQCSVFYGEESFFIPAHQALTDDDIHYFSEVITSFIELSANGRP